MACNVGANMQFSTSFLSSIKMLSLLILLSTTLAFPTKSPNSTDLDTSRLTDVRTDCYPATTAAFSIGPDSCRPLLDKHYSTSRKYYVGSSSPFVWSDPSAPCFVSFYASRGNDFIYVSDSLISWRAGLILEGCHDEAHGGTAGLVIATTDEWFVAISGTYPVGPTPRVANTTDEETS